MACEGTGIVKNISIALCLLALVSCSQQEPPCPYINIGDQVVYLGDTGTVVSVYAVRGDTKNEPWLWRAKVILNKVEVHEWGVFVKKSRSKHPYVCVDPRVLCKVTATP
jgi:hypothetical protein